jgi:hypothetical protein
MDQVDLVLVDPLHTICYLLTCVFIGSTSAIASISGPLEVRLREEVPERATFEVTHRPLEGVAGEWIH